MTDKRRAEIKDFLDRAVDNFIEYRKLSSHNNEIRLASVGDRILLGYGCSRIIDELAEVAGSRVIIKSNDDYNDIVIKYRGVEFKTWEKRSVV